MNVELRLTDEGGAGVIKNLWPLYVHDLSEFDGRMANRHGLLLADESVTTLTGHGETQNGWWKRPDALFPYLVVADGPNRSQRVNCTDRLLHRCQISFVPSNPRITSTPNEAPWAG